MVIMLLASGPIQKILSSFRHTQIAVHLMLIAVNQPVTALIFFGGLTNLVNLQLFDLTDNYNRFFHLDPNSRGNAPLNSQFELMGYESLYVVQNFGFLCIKFLTPCLLYALTSLLVYLSRKRKNICGYDLNSLKEKSKRWLLFEFWICFIDDTYLFLFVCANLNLKGYFIW